MCARLKSYMIHQMFQYVGHEIFRMFIQPNRPTGKTNVCNILEASWRLVKLEMCVLKQYQWLHSLCFQQNSLTHLADILFTFQNYGIHNSFTTPHHKKTCNRIPMIIVTECFFSLNIFYFYEYTSCRCISSPGSFFFNFFLLPVFLAHLLLGLTSCVFIPFMNPLSLHLSMTFLQLF